MILVNAKDTTVGAVMSFLGIGNEFSYYRQSKLFRSSQFQLAYGPCFSTSKMTIKNLRIFVCLGMFISKAKILRRQYLHGFARGKSGKRTYHLFLLSKMCPKVVSMVSSGLLYTHQVGQEGRFSYEGGNLSGNHLIGPYFLIYASSVFLPLFKAER